jgi:hypothetical protein
LTVREQGHRKGRRAGRRPLCMPQLLRSATNRAVAISHAARSS